MPMDGLLFTALRTQLDNALSNAHIDRIIQPSTNELCIQVRQRDVYMSLFISIDPSLPTVHLRDHCPDRKSGTRAPSIEKLLIPGRILQVRQDPFERILHIDIEGRDETGARTCRTVTVEMLGQKSNVIISYKDTGMIIDALRHISGSTGPREIAPQIQYVAPSQGEQTPPDTFDYETFDRLVRLNPDSLDLVALLSRSMLGVSPFAAREFLLRLELPIDIRPESVSVADRERLWRLITDLAQKCTSNVVEPTAVRRHGKIEFWVFPIFAVKGDTYRFNTLSSLLQWSYDERRQKSTIEQLKRRLRTVCNTELKRVLKKARLQEKAVKDGKNADEYRMCGDLLMAQLHKVKPKCDRVTLPNLFENGNPKEIRLNPSLTPVENATRFYKRYQKAKNTVIKAREHLHASVSEKAYIESVLQTIEMTDATDDLHDIEDELIQSGYIQLGKRQRKRDGHTRDGSEPLKFRSSDGINIFVGKNNRQNDLLTMRMAKPHDFWLHVKDIPGAHVIIQSEGRRELPERTIWEAAHLAAHYSKAKDSGTVPVDMTQRRYVNKPKGARPGMVIYDNERTLFVTPDSAVPSKLSIK